jgi:hypothetical protein
MMTRTRKIAHARRVRARLARFVDCQDRDIVLFIESEGGDAGELAMRHLLAAQRELGELIQVLQAENAGRQAARDVMEAEKGR